MVLKMKGPFEMHFENNKDVEVNPPKFYILKEKLALVKENPEIYYRFPNLWSDPSDPHFRSTR